MRRKIRWLIVFLLALLCFESARAQEARLANGVAIKGEVLRALQEGLEIQTPAGPRVFPWPLLSAGTRYRHQPAYKANIGAIQEGRPSSERKSTPALPSAASPAEAPALALPAAAPASAPAAPAVSAQEPAPAPKAAPKPAPKKAAPPPDTRLTDTFGFSYATPNSLRPREIPGLKLRDDSLTMYQVFQYGPGADDLLYLAFDTASLEHPHDVMFVYAPSISTYARTPSEKGQSKGPANNREIHFKPITFASQYGSLSAKYELTCVYARRRLLLNLWVDVAQGMNRSSYRLYLEPGDLFTEANTVLKAKRMFDLPVLNCRSLDPRNKRRLGFLLNMGPFYLLPEKGMDKRLNIQALNNEGKVLEKQVSKMDEVNYTGGTPAGARFTVQKLKPGESCVVEATINLGPIFGPLRREQKIELDEED